MIAIHINPNIENQVNYGTALAEGFKVHGVKHNLTTDIEAKGDTHCIIGPWYAFRRYQSHDRVLYLDRACWDHPERTCINWLSKGDKVWEWGRRLKARYHPKTKPWKYGNNLVVLCDYNDDGLQQANLTRPHFNVSIRRHPSNLEQESLASCLANNEVAIGKRSTALVDAAIHGLAVITYDHLSPVYPVAGRLRDIRRPDRSGWLRDLSWHNWTINEIKSGETWQHLRSSQPQQLSQ